jgi:DNA-binding transcriptional LysR family regulator
MFNLERLRTLQAVARHGSVSAAADGLHITTSAVSQQLAKLEREAGQRLVARNGRGIRLTDAGLLLAEHAGLILAQVERAQADLEAHQGLIGGRLRLGAFPTALRGLVPGAVAELRTRHAQLSLNVYECEPEQCVRRLVRGDLDVGIVLDWYNKPFALPDGLVKAPLLDDTADLVVPAGHPLAERESVRLEEFAEDEWICWQDGGFCHEWLTFTLRSKGFEPKFAHWVEEHPTQLALVAAGLGVAVMPRLGRGAVPDACRVLTVRHPVRRHLYALWSADADRRPSIQAAVDALRTSAEQAAA